MWIYIGLYVTRAPWVEPALSMLKVAECKVLFFENPLQKNGIVGKGMGDMATNKIQISFGLHHHHLCEHGNIMCFWHIYNNSYHILNSFIVKILCSFKDKMPKIVCSHDIKYHMFHFSICSFWSVVKLIGLIFLNHPLQ